MNYKDLPPVRYIPGPGGCLETHFANGVVTHSGGPKCSNRTTAPRPTLADTITRTGDSITLSNGLVVERPSTAREEGDRVAEYAKLLEHQGATPSEAYHRAVRELRPAAYLRLP